MKKVVGMPLLALTFFSSSVFGTVSDYGDNQGHLSTQASIIQSTYGEQGNFEMVVAKNGQLCHYERNNDEEGDSWSKVECFGSNITSAPSLIQSDYGEKGNLELVVREGDDLCHYYKRTNNNPDNLWDKSECLPTGNFTSAPSLIQSDYGEEHGNFELVVREVVDGVDKVCHYYRANNKERQPWSKSECFGSNITSAPSLIQSNYGEKHGNFEVVVGEGDKLAHYWRANNKENNPWSRSEFLPKGNFTSAPSLIQSNYGERGNFEVIVREGDQLAHYARRNDQENNPWSEPVYLPKGNFTSAPTFIQSNYGGEHGNFELLVRENGQMYHYWRKNNTEDGISRWHKAEPIGLLLTNLNSVEKVLGPDETYIIQNKYAHDIYDKMIIKIKGKSGSGQTVIIKDSKFINAHQVIETENIDNVIIEGNYFENIGEAIRVRNVKTIRVQYNKVKNFGMVGRDNPRYKEDDSDWGKKHFCQVINSPQINSLNISYNLVDRSNNNCTENIQENVFAEDYININNSKMIDNKKGLISENYLMGSVKHCESASAGGIVIDQLGSGFEIKDNVIYNTGQYLIGSASSDKILIKDNIGFITFEHEYHIRLHSIEDDSTSEVAGFIISTYCDECDGISGDITVEGNRLLAEVSKDDPPTLSYYDNWIENTVNKDLLTFKNNNFTIDNPTEGGLDNPTSEEVLDMIIGDNRGMFITHGQGKNYFDESRGVVFQEEEDRRFTRNNGVLIDSETELEWQDAYTDNKVKSGQWFSIEEYCTTLDLDGGDWRMPNDEELKSIDNDSSFFQYTSYYPYWSSDMSGDYENLGYNIPPITERDQYLYHIGYAKSPSLPIRCVR